MKAALALSVLLCGLAAVSCGGSGGSESDEEQVQTAVEQFAQAIEDKDRANFCLAITTGSQMDLFGKKDPLGSCIETAGLVGERGVFGVSIDASSVEAEDIEVNGDRATVDLGGERDMRLARVAGDWRIELSPGP